MLSPTASVLIVTYNHERYVERAIASALAQTYAPLEVVVVDDGSTDGTAERARRIGDPRVRVLAREHVGLDRLRETYEAGVRACGGDLVAFLEGDDEWPPEKLAHQVIPFREPDVVVAHGPYAVIGARGTVLRDRVVLGPRRQAGAYDALPDHLLASYVMPVTAVVRRADLSATGVRQLATTPHWDYPTFLALAERGRFAFVPEVVGLWRKHASSATARGVGGDMHALDVALALALETRRRLAPSRPDLPDEGRIRRSWSEAYARHAWQVARVLLLGRRFSEARELAARGLRARSAPSVRARLVLAWLAATVRTDVESLSRWAGRRSPIDELS